MRIGANSVARAAGPLVATVLAVVAAGQARADDAWQFELTPYLWATSMKGDVGAPGALPRISVNSSFSDIVDHLDVGFMGGFEARKGRWGFLFDSIYMNVSGAAVATRTGPLDRAVLASANANLRIKQTMLGGAAAYRLTEGATAVDALGGLRFSRISGEARIDAAFFGQAGTAIRKADEEWVDPYAGLRVLHTVSERWTLMGYADIGGFGIGSDLTWQFAAGVNYAFSKNVTGKVGYRYLKVDYDKGGFLYDMANGGLYAGAGIRF